jgi:hypothetical protein
MYPDALAVASGKAGTILTGVAEVGGARASAAVVRQELAAIYRAFLPDEGKRGKALLFHAQWLDSLCSPGTDPAPETQAFGTEPGPDLRKLEVSRSQPYDTANSIRTRPGCPPLGARVS